MNFRWLLLSFGIVGLTACDSPKETVDEHEVVDLDEPGRTHILLEAEDCEVLGEEAKDRRASGSAYVNRQSGDSQPVFRCEIPASESPLTVWLRRKGGAVKIRVSTGTDERESHWAYEAQDSFEWTSFGEIPPGAEGRQLTAIGNNNNEETVSIDCVLFSTDPVEDKDTLLTPLPSVSIDPGKTTGDFRSAPALWGMNLYSGSDPKTLAHPGYIENVAYLAPHLVRVHNVGKLDDSGKNRHGLIDVESRKWDENKVRVALYGLLELEKVGDIVINIPGWPDWMDEDRDGFLDSEKTGEYVDLVSRFAEIVWEFPNARERVLFEITNELDMHYHERLVATKKPHRVAQLARLYLHCSRRIREVAPGARIGGPSVANAENMEFHQQFIALTAPELDFYSIHLYVSGDPDESDSHILSTADSAGQQIAAIKEILAKNSRNREIPLSVNEYNIARSWETREERMKAGFGAVWDAWFMITLFSAGVDSAAAWNENDGIYGKFSRGEEPRPAAHLYHVLNTEFTGPIARLETIEREDVAALATESGNRLLISHRGLRSRIIKLPEGTWSGWMTLQGTEAPQAITAEGETTLPGISLLYLEK